MADLDISDVETRQLYVTLEASSYPRCHWSLHSALCGDSPCCGHGPLHVRFGSILDLCDSLCLPFFVLGHLSLYLHLPIELVLRDPFLPGRVTFLLQRVEDAAELG